MQSEAANDRGGVGSRSFIGLVLTQLFGVFNDNMLRWFAVPAAQTVMDKDLSLSVGLACFTVPYLLFAVPAGFVADRFSKRTVIVTCKVAEILIMAIAIWAVSTGSPYFLFGVVALAGTHSALFTPSKYGSIPELVSHENLSAANGWMGLTTVVASAAGFVAGYALYGAVLPDLKNPPTYSGFESLAEAPYGAVLPDLKNPPTISQLTLPAAALIGVAVAGTLMSLLIRSTPIANPDRKPNFNVFAAAWHDLKLLKSNQALFRTALGIAFFWMLASLSQLTIDPFAQETLGLAKQHVGVLGAILVLGLGVGSVLAGMASKGKVELGIVPVGAAGITASAILLFVTGKFVDPTGVPTEQISFYLSCTWLFMLGASAGFFDIPLESNLQHRSEASTRGTILAATNFMTFGFILGASVLFYFLRSVLDFTPGAVFLIGGLGTFPVIAFAFMVLPQATVRFIVWVTSLFVYRIKVVGKEHIPEQGGALIVCNHVTWLDGILMLLISDRPVRMLAYADYVAGKGWISWLCDTFGVIPIKGNGGPRALIQALKTAREAAINGELVCIFAEGALTRTGQLQSFQRGLLRIVEGTQVPVVPAYLDQLWGSVFSYQRGRFFWKLPNKWPFPVTILFGRPIADPDSVNEVRQAVEQLGVDAVSHRHNFMIPPRQMLRACKAARTRSKIADSAGMDLTGGKFLTATLALGRVLMRDHLAADEKMVGVLLPPSAGGAIVNAALALHGRTSVNLNYTLSDEVVNYCIKEAGIRHVITSQKFLEKKPMQLDAEVILVEDVKAGVKPMDKLAAAYGAFVEPVALLERRLGLHRIAPDDLLTVIFTSGSTGEPKGVMLSHKNVGSNIASVNQLFQLIEKDTLLGVLPFFHSFGYCLMLWAPLTLPPKGVYHFNPLDGRTIGHLCEKHRVTIIAATPTFLKTYLKRCTKEQMQHVDLAICGAEKLPEALAKEFQDAFGVWPTEGYGATELSPLASCTVPDERNNAAGTGQSGWKPGTVGRPIPNCAARVIDPDTRQDLGVNKPGLLQIKGPNVMVGYLNRPDKTAEAIQDGWYNTGDIAVIDDEGFITITGRLSRFSKIGGEMVPHIRIEEELARIVEDGSSEEPEIRVAVTAVPDANKGERIIVLHKKLSKPIDQILNELSAAGLPNLWLPGADCFLEVEIIPLLGTGKLDLRGIKDVASAKFAK